jgi:DNA repair protein RadC
MNYAINNTEEEAEAAGPVVLARFERSPRLAELKAVYRSRTRAAERPKVRAPEDVTAYLRAVWDRDSLELFEEFVVVCLNAAHQVVGWVKASRGGFDAAAVDPRLVFGIALQTASSALIVAHNHPSGELTPSEQDREVTRRLKEAGRLLGIAVLDHIILTRESSFSFSEHGLM